MFFVDDVLAGSLRYWINGRSSFRQAIIIQLTNTTRIWGGLFQGSPSQILSRFTWEIIQTVFGFLTAHLANLTRHVNRVGYFYGCTVLEGGGVGGSLCLGTHIILYCGRLIGDIVTMHEYGHALQSRASGPLYFFKYGISSLLANRTSWAEADANYRMAAFFGEKASPAFQKNRRFASHRTNPKWWEYVLFFLGIGIVLIPVLNYEKGRWPAVPLSACLPVGRSSQTGTGGN